MDKPGGMSEGQPITMFSLKKHYYELRIMQSYSSGVQK